MSASEFSIIISVLGVGLGLAILQVRTTVRLDRRIDQTNEKSDADRRAFQAEATADRRAMQQSMETFRAEMHRLAERQSRIEGPTVHAAR